MSASISLSNLLPAEKSSLSLRVALSLLDRIIGIKKMDRIYKQHQMQNMSKEDFARKLLDVMDISVQGGLKLQQSIPKTGPLVIASNHPFGGIEGVILCLLIGEIRPDLKVLANLGLKLFAELKDYFIFTNPLSEKDPKNTPSIRTSLTHVQQGGALLIFPAGRVSYYQAAKKRISEHDWNRVVGKLVSASNAQYLPIFIEGQNSPWFYRLGRVYFRVRMLMLAREFLNKQNSVVNISCGNPVKSSVYSPQNTIHHAALCRVQSYCQDPNWRLDWPANHILKQQTIGQPVEWRKIQHELEVLPPEQCLLTHNDFSVYYAMHGQIPATLNEIARLLELVFRLHNEGSGEPIESDDFDQTYTHLFVVNHSKQHVVGAYRMGRTDVLLQDNDLTQLYLARMFNFSSEFVNRRAPCLELGRSFLIPEYQRSFQGLLLLWRGIGTFVCKFPHYRTLYGTVSLSKLYDTRSVAIMKHALVTPTDKVSAQVEFEFPLHPELHDYANTYSLKDDLAALLACIEEDGKDIPVLAKHYQKLGAQFHSLGIDKNFNDTPGLLLSVDLAKAPEKLLKLYMGKGWQAYRNGPL
ncbi:lysophospholipid acyltransferase family protein [Aliiglaciecola sp. LCG003]|uniref:lysophospholipid acyltransferase family protein n=1 Tax=Aliiglaciecola sp. LCG003 TaxID=3053655 RepID=UPI002573C877|nr:lysophospholipid acyltransferase family protein [Aliiglaciecola sp. LCG003]WJG09832.1 lysophospholipid acyltransferase family protein [Aliiglaciecola sp. LCG003]